MNILLTGGAGFIGSHVCELLIKNKHKVTIIDDLSSGSIDNLSCINNDNYKFYNSKLEEFDFNNINKMDGVIHLAAQASVPFSISNFYNSSKTNLLSSIKIIDYCSNNNIPLVYASSSAVYGSLSYGNDLSMDIDLISPYAADKYSLEVYTKMAHNVYGLSNIGLRFFNVYGPRQDPSNPYSGVISIFIDRLLAKKNIRINGGKQTRDFIYVSDIAYSIYQALITCKEKKINSTINILTGKSISINELADILIKNLSPGSKKEFHEYIEGDPLKSEGNLNKLTDDLEIDASKFVQLEEGLKNTIESYEH